MSTKTYLLPNNFTEHTWPFFKSPRHFGVISPFTTTPGSIRSTERQRAMNQCMPYKVRKSNQPNFVHVIKATCYNGGIPSQSKNEIIMWWVWISYQLELLCYFQHANPCSPLITTMKVVPVRILIQMHLQMVQPVHYSESRI